MRFRFFSSPKQVYEQRGQYAGREMDLFLLKLLQQEGSPIMWALKIRIPKGPHSLTQATLERNLVLQASGNQVRIDFASVIPKLL